MTQQTNVPATQAQAPKKVDVLKGIINAPSIQEQFRNALSENKDAFVASLIDLYVSDSYLQKCEPKAVVMEALKAATLKLPINKALGFAYVVPYKGVPVFQIGYKGLIQLAMRTGQYRIINADVVYEGEVKSTNKLTGEIDLSGEKKSNKIVGYFAHIELINGFCKTMYSTKEQVTEHAKRFSKSFSNSGSAWQSDFDAMAKKTLLRNLLSHYGYLSVEMVGAIDKDVQADTDERDQAIRETANTQSIDMDTVDFEEVQETEEMQEAPQAQPEQPKTNGRQTAAPF